MKIAVYTITKNEEQFIERWAKSCEDADYRLIVDTGSTDNTVSVAEANGCVVQTIIIRPWRFDDARNAALALIPEDIDYCIALDADEILTPGWRQAIEAVPSNVTRPRYKYVWSWNPDGTEGLTYSGDKIHARKNYRWRHPVHEVITCCGEEQQGWCGLEIHHHPDNTKSRSQYLPLLEQAVREDPNDDRNRFYLGRELMFHGRNADAEVHLRKHLELSTWRAERATCMRYLGRVTGDREHWLLRACGESPDRREPWVELAQYYYEQRNWWQCLSSAMRALEITVKPLEYLCEAEAWGSQPHDLASVAAWNLGHKELAISQSRIALNLNPVDKRLRDNYSLVTMINAKTKIDVVIPCKSNIDGLKKVVASLDGAPNIEKVIVIADGEKAKKAIDALNFGGRVIVDDVPEGVGIHAMWNKGMVLGNPDNHVCFINDDVEINPDTVPVLGGQLDAESDLGLICPNYDGRFIPGAYQLVYDVCGGRYNGTGGLAGFCMMLNANVRAAWRFDERMLWWFGDDDVLHWVRKGAGKQVAISGLASCASNESWTINNDPPKDFATIVENDRKIFHEKWGTG